MLDEKNVEALKTKGAEGVLLDFVNLLTNYEEMEEIEKFGNMDGGLYPLPLDQYHGMARIFQQVWKDRSPAQLEALNRQLEMIFERRPELVGTVDPTHERPAIVVDSAHGSIGVTPRTMLDILGVAILTNIKKLAMCEREGCPTPYFIKKHARQRFCSTDCADTVRGRKKKAWQDTHRDELIEKKRRERRVARQRRPQKAKGRPSSARS